MSFQGTSVDPGVNKGHGVANWYKGELLSAYLLDSDDCLTGTDRGILVVEIPVVRATGQQIGRQSDIVNLAIAAGKFIGRHATLFESVVELYPEQWGRQIPPAVKYTRILERLTEEEKSRIDWPKIKALRADVVMAIGIGFHVFSPERSLTRRGA